MQVLGSHNGAVYVLNLDGRLLKTFRPHAAMVNDLSLDLQSEFVASASMDGKLFFHRFEFTVSDRLPLHTIRKSRHSFSHDERSSRL